jgi:hypothetical protein
MKAREPMPDISTAMSITAFCEMFCITPELYAALKRTGLGPRDVRIGDVRFGSHSGLKSDIAARPKSANRRLIHRSKRYCCRPDTSGPELAAARQKANITKIRGVRQLTDVPRIRH